MAVSFPSEQHLAADVLDVPESSVSEQHLVEEVTDMLLS